MGLVMGDLVYWSQTPGADVLVCGCPALINYCQ